MLTILPNPDTRLEGFKQWKSEGKLNYSLLTTAVSLKAVPKVDDHISCKILDVLKLITYLTEGKLT